MSYMRDMASFGSYVEADTFSVVNVSKPIAVDKQFYDYILQLKIASWNLADFMFGVRAFYAVLFCIGITGNVWVLCVVGYILKVLRGVIQNPNLFIYILFMSVVDVLVLLSLPILITNLYLLQWVFGRYLCKVYWIVESTNKMLSTFILCALSCERYLTICHPKKQCSVRSTGGTLKLIGILTAFVVILLIPVYLFADQYLAPEYFTMGNETYSVEIRCCNLIMTYDVLLAFTVYMFTIGFCVPAFMIVYFYTRILCKMYSHTSKFRNRANSQVPVRRVTCTIFVIIVFYFVCWAPYWGITLHSILVPEFMVESSNIQLSYALHSLVYVKSAFNWLPYSFLNKQLRECRNLAIRNRQRKLMMSSCYFNDSSNNRISGPSKSPQAQMFSDTRV